MIPTKTYPLSAIMGNELTDKERIAELEAQLKHCEGHAAELEAELTMRREPAEGLQNQWVKDTQKIVALEAEVKALREAMDKYSEDEMLERRRKLPTKIFGPNLVEILNAAGFYKKKDWVGLTDEELFKCSYDADERDDAMRAVEAKLKEKNGG